METDVDRIPDSIQSFIFLDIEASGLFPTDSMNPMEDPPIPGDRRNLTQMLRNHIRLTSSQQAPHILEISLVSATRKAVLSGIKKMISLVQGNEEYSEEVPSGTTVSDFRIPCNVYTAQIKPKMKSREWTDYEKRRRCCSALVYTQEDLEGKNDFATEWRGLRLFLEQTPKPACLIAHNGLKFDFRALYAEFERNNMLNTRPIPDQVYFIDSYLMFLDLEKKLHDELRTAVRLFDWSHLSAQIKNAGVQRVSEVSSISHSANTTPHSSPSAACHTIATVKSESDVTKTSEIHDTVVVEELRSTVLASPPEPQRPARRRLFDETSDDHPLNFIRTSQWSPAKKKRVRPSLFIRSSEGDWMFDSHFSVKYFRERGAFKLESMYKQLLDCTFNAHFAEDDCVALLKICVAYGDEFVDYVDAYAAKFPY